MKQVVSIVALRCVRYNDSHNILTVYSRENGRMALLLAAGGGKEAVRRRSLLQPLSMAEIEVNVMRGHDIHRIGEVRPLGTHHSVAVNPLKASVAMFLAEVLGIVLREGGADARVFDFIASSITVLNELPGDRVANFHLRFLWGLADLLGIAPDTGSYAPGRVFDFAAGRWGVSAPLHNDCLIGMESDFVARLGRMTYGNMHRFRLSRSERDRAITGILHYYSIHHTPMDGVKSLDILRSIFG